jgi:hypothetical protein
MPAFDATTEPPEAGAPELTDEMLRRGVGTLLEYPITDCDPAILQEALRAAISEALSPKQP